MRYLDVLILGAHILKLAIVLRVRELGAPPTFAMAGLDTYLNVLFLRQTSFVPILFYSKCRPCDVVAGMS